MDPAIPLLDDTPSELQLEQCGRQSARVEFRLKQQFISRRGTLREHCENSGFQRIRFAALRPGWTRRSCDLEIRPARKPQIFDHVTSASDRSCAIAQELIRALRKRTLDRPGHDENLTPLIESVAHRDQRPASATRLDHDDREAEATDNTIA